MSYLQDFASLIDPLAVAFLIGSLAMIYGIIHVLRHPLDLESRPEDEEPGGSSEPERRAPSDPAPPAVHTPGSRPR